MITVVSPASPLQSWITSAADQTIIVETDAAATFVNAFHANALVVNYGSVNTNFVGGSALASVVSGRIENMAGAVANGDWGALVDGAGDVTNAGVLIGRAQHGVHLSGGANHNTVVNSGEIFGAL